MNNADFNPRYFIEDSIENPYIKSLIGTLSRTYISKDGLDEKDPKHKSILDIQKNHFHYFHNSELRRAGGECWPVEADTMVGIFRLNNIYNLFEDVIKNNVKGDFVETGVWKGGACVLANAIIHEHNQQDSRKVYLFDSFEGLPKPYMKEDEGDLHHIHDCLSISLETVTDVFKNYNLLTDNVKFKKGWFIDTMKNVDDIEKISILRLDGDMYSSTIEVLNALYNKVETGGYIIVDDWGLENARKAVYDFIIKNRLSVKIEWIDGCSVYWKKEETPNESWPLHKIGLYHGTDKSTYHYFSDEYDKKLSHLRNEKINFLEIGLWQGASIFTWHDYFKNATIYGADVLDCSRFNNERTQIFYANQEDENSLRRLPRELDVIVDDGGHTMFQQQLTLKVMFLDHLKNGGTYILEDLHTSLPHYYHNMGSDPYNNTLNLLEDLKTGVPRESSTYYISDEEFFRLKHSIESIEIVKIKEDSITSFIKKK